jgi:hypothetical protein
MLEIILPKDDWEFSWPEFERLESLSEWLTYYSYHVIGIGKSFDYVFDLIKERVGGRKITMEPSSTPIRGAEWLFRRFQWGEHPTQMHKGSMSRTPLGKNIPHLVIWDAQEKKAVVVVKESELRHLLPEADQVIIDLILREYPIIRVEEIIREVGYCPSYSGQGVWNVPWEKSYTSFKYFVNKFEANQNCQEIFRSNDAYKYRRDQRDKLDRPIDPPMYDRRFIRDCYVKINNGSWPTDDWGKKISLCPIFVKDIVQAAKGCVVHTHRSKTLGGKS